MNILFATAQPFTPQMVGGLQASADELAVRLRDRGHNVSTLCALMPNGFLGLRARIIMKLFGHKAARDTGLGYSVWRAWFPWESLEWVAERIKPDVVVVLARQPVRVALAARKLNLPVLMMLQDVMFSDHGGSFAELGNITCVANSEFTANKYRKAFGVDPTVIYPLINGKEKYQTQTTRENVTFINPHPLKGVDLAIAVARECPEIPFSFVEGWPMKQGERQALEIKLLETPNVKLRPSTKDMREIYGKCRILLVPSRCEEAYGRVASEAQFSGIPVVASDRGGLPEAVGFGGILLDPDGPIEEWVTAVKYLWNEDGYYQALSDAAYEYSECTSLRWETQLSIWEDILLNLSRNSKQ